MNAVEKHSPFAVTVKGVLLFTGVSRKHSTLEEMLFKYTRGYRYKVAPAQQNVHMAEQIFHDKMLNPFNSKEL